MNYEQQFLADFSEWIDAQTVIMAKAVKLAEAEHQEIAKIRYESRLDAYHFMQGKFENYRNGKDFHELPDLGIRKF